MRERTMIADGGGHPAQPYEAKRTQKHSPARQRKQDQADKRGEVDQYEPRQHQRVFVTRPPPRPLPRRVHRRPFEGSCAIQLIGPETAAEIAAANNSCSTRFEGRVIDMALLSLGQLAGERANKKPDEQEG